MFVAIKDWNQSRINDFLVQRNIDWRINSPRSSHHGGAWERLIRSVRRILVPLNNEQFKNEETLQILMCEIESILNALPFTTICGDPRDLDVITPNYLLLLKNTNYLPPGLFNPKDIYFKRRWKQINYLVDIF